MNETAAEGDPERLRAEDALARRAALDVTRSFIVQAPAGSGKTGLLIQRYLALLAHVEAPEEIVAITFTRKATAEMRARVLEALAAAGNAAPPDELHQRVSWELARAARARDGEAQWNLADNPNRLRIQTIDSLCRWLTLRLPVLSGFGAQPEAIEDAQDLYLEAARRTLAGLDARCEWSGHVARILKRLDNHVERAQGLIADMLRVRDQWIRSVLDPRGRHRAALETALANATRDALASLLVLCPLEARAALPALADYAAENLEAAGRESPIRACRALAMIPGAAPEDLEAWRGLAELLLTQSGEPRSRIDAGIGFTAPAGAKGAQKERRAAAIAALKEIIARLAPHRTFVEQLHFTRTLPPAAYSDAQWDAVEALVGLLPVAVAELEVLFKERGQVDFTAVAQAAVRALGEPGSPTDLALALDYRIRHILVDEFQDTSWSQHDLLAGLTAGWAAGDGHTLFVVGDPMQSIYRFRKAEVGLYMRAWHHGIGAVKLEPLRLAVNFRSTRAIIEWFNRAFAAVLPDEEDLASGAVPFARSVAEDSAVASVTPQFHPLPAGDRDAEARLVAEIVRQARAQDPAQTVAILVRARGHLAAIAPALKAAGLRFQAIEIEKLTHRPLVQDLLALTRALVHPADRIAWLAVLRAPWCGLALADLDALAGHDHAAALWTLMDENACKARLSEDGTARLARVRGVLGAALASRRREPLRRWIEGAWLALGGPAAAENATDLEDAQVFFAALEEMDEGADVPDLDLLAARVEELYALPDADREAPRVQLMTIHKAKGLEFDTVIVPGLGYPPRREEPKLLAWLERPREAGEPDLLLAPIKEAAERDDAVYRYLRDLERVKEEHEAARLLYVAATRARSRLHLIGQVDWNAKALKPRPRSLLEHLWPVVRAAFEEVVQSAATENGECAAAARTPPAFIRRFAPGWRPPAPPASLDWKQPAAPAGMGRSLHDQVEFSWASETAKHVGTVVHRFLQRIAEEGLDQWDAPRIAAMQPVFGRDLARLGVPDAEMKDAMARVAAALGANLTHARGRWVLGAYPEARSELKLTGVIGGEIVSVAIDRTFVDEHGTRWIVDFKTSVHEGADVEGFLDNERLRYRAQLERYAALVRGLDARPLSLGIYFPLLNGWREWSFGDARP
ncbi:MAG: UvrD-helicase domain-containing protein [Betaproteobacteria bacterium]|nr:UvrD-helicase domain-containing protein [Betaproteobacteria bacterium]